VTAQAPKMLSNDLDQLPSARRSVPWGGLDILAVVAVYLLLLTASMTLAQAILGPELTQPLPKEDAEAPGAAHPVIILIFQHNIWIDLACGISAVVAAPIAEEFFFRLLLLGWLDKVQWKLFGNARFARRWLAAGVVPIAITSVLFASMHFRFSGEKYHPQYTLATMLCGSIAGLLAVAFAALFIGYHWRATSAQLGWDGRQLVNDAILGVGAFAASVVPVFAVQYVSFFFIPKNLADPVPLFVFALVLGYLYHRTGRILPSIVAHASLNAFSLTMSLASQGIEIGG
jgi:membrane protease YdiL (CAAX protease family)